MAIANCDIKSLSRQNSKTGSLRNICSAVAYRSGEKLRSIEDEEIKYPHRNTNDIEHNFMLNNPYGSRQELWNEVEKAELKKDRTIKDNPCWAREVLIAIPKELSIEQRINLVEDYGKQIAEKYNVAVDSTLYTEKNGNGNFYALILITTRNVINGALGKKDRQFNGNEAKKTIFDFRNTWEETTNKHLENAGKSERISLQRVDKNREYKNIHHYGNPELIQENERRKNLEEQNNISKELKILNSNKNG